MWSIKYHKEREREKTRVRNRAMEKFGRSIVCLVIVLLFLAPGEVTSLEEEKRTCESQSHGFKGRCLSDHNCGLVCRNEGFPQGKCRGFRQRCFCVRPC